MDGTEAGASPGGETLTIDYSFSTGDLIAGSPNSTCGLGYVGDLDELRVVPHLRPCNGRGGCAFPVDGVPVRGHSRGAGVDPGSARFGGIEIPLDRLNGQPTFPLSALLAPGALQAMKAILDTLVDNIRPPAMPPALEPRTRLRATRIRPRRYRRRSMPERRFLGVIEVDSGTLLLGSFRIPRDRQLSKLVAYRPVPGSPRVRRTPVRPMWFAHWSRTRLASVPTQCPRWSARADRLAVAAEVTGDGADRPAPSCECMGLPVFSLCEHGPGILRGCWRGTPTASSGAPPRGWTVRTARPGCSDLGRFGDQLWGVSADRRQRVRGPASSPE